MQLLNPHAQGLAPEFLGFKTQKSICLKKIIHPFSSVFIRFSVFAAGQARVDNADYTVGEFIDILDTQRTWLRGRIVSINEEKNVCA